MTIVETLKATISAEIDRRAGLLGNARGGSIQFIVQLDSAGVVKQIKTSVQVASGVIPK